MSATDHIDVLLSHDRWATDQLLSACEKLSDEQLDRPFEMGHGSVRATVVHMLNVIAGWQDALIERADGTEVAAGASVAEMKAAHARIADSFESFARQVRDRDVLTPSRGPKRMTTPPAPILVHILTHGTHHRAQAINMLRHLGSVLQWMFATGIAKLEDRERV